MAEEKTEGKKKDHALLDTLVAGAIQGAVRAGAAVSAIEKAAGISISLGVSRDQFVGFMGKLAGTLYDVVAARRKEAAEDGVDGEAT